MLHNRFINGKFNSKEIEYIISNINNMSIKQIAIDLSRKYISVYIFSKKLEKKGKLIIPKRTRHVYNFNHDFFKYQSINNAYWAGFIAADGNIKKNTHLLRIEISQLDIHLLQNFKNEIESNNPIYLYNKNRLSCSIEIYSKNITMDLKNNYKIVPKKSLILEYPKFLNKEIEDLYILGYIDGDGCIYFKNNHDNRISICGTYDTLYNIKKRFSTICKKDVGRIKKTKNIFVYNIKGVDFRNIFIHYFKIKHFKLKRKWKKRIYKYCKNTIKNNKKVTLPIYKQICKLYKTGMSNIEISKIIGIKPSSIKIHTEKYKKYMKNDNNLDIEDAS